jgi:hypothetical protein
MDRFVARQNIEHYRRKLATEEDETKREMLLRLLAEEESKLAALGAPPQKEKRPRTSFPPIRASESGIPQSAPWFRH